MLKELDLICHTLGPLLLILFLPNGPRCQCICTMCYDGAMLILFFFTLSLSLCTCERDEVVPVGPPQGGTLLDLLFPSSTSCLSVTVRMASQKRLPPRQTLSMSQVELPVTMRQPLETDGLQTACHVYRCCHKRQESNNTLP